MAAERSNGAPGGAPVRPIPPHECPNSSMLAKDMCIKDVRRETLIGAVGDGEFAIALGDMGQKQRKSLVAVCTHSFLRVDPARKCTSKRFDFAQFFDKIKYKETSEKYKTYMVGSGTGCPTP